MRAHVVLPEEMIEEIDRVAGKRGRSKFIEEAVHEKLALKRQREAIAKARAGAFRIANPDWSTPQKVSEWVHEGRRREAEELDRKIERWHEQLNQHQPE
jgi:metal-responsive CopG/Arc/MetJ family transcriptional regulator